VVVELDFPKMNSHWVSQGEKQGQQVVAQLPLLEKAMLSLCFLKSS